MAAPVHSGEFKRAAFLSGLGLLTAWWFQVEQVICSPDRTNFAGYTLFWLTFSFMVLYYGQSIRKASNKGKAIISPTFPNLPRRRSSVFDAPVLTKTGHSPLLPLASFSCIPARRGSVFDAQTPLPQSELAGRYDSSYTLVNPNAPWPKVFARSQTVKNGTKRPIKMPSSIQEVSTDEESTCCTLKCGSPKSGWSMGTECTSSLITCSTIDVTFGNPAEVLTALSLVMLAGFTIATYRHYGIGSLVIGMITGLGICNLAELFKIFSNPVTLRWILALTTFHSLNFPSHRSWLLFAMY
eukprot:Gregarina_sp_Poly_1__3432@NODE_199_length_11565_cov_209_900244_g178_i0_p6_GENE_NODE_199_length_11565_cov_209_900244_g178_i0NODE_199_length_11565_cov_209_900244_g178_i0_p6_ORF_typecomplete_len297_score19_31_NODE_199_length_11565_cov_209_900244_g178_i082379127